MQIRINGSANLSQVKAEFAALEAQVTGLNAAMAKGANAPALNPKGYQMYTSAVQAGSKAFRDSLASSGAFRVEQMKLNAATDHYTDMLQRQKLSFREVFGTRNRALMRGIYQEQLKLRDLQVRPAGKDGMFDVSVPRAYRQELDTLNSRLNFTGAQLKSAGTHMVNFGKNTQWAGRQLTVGLTMPVVALGAAAAVMAYKVDQQMTRVRKVYDTTADQSSTRMQDMMAVQKEFADLNKASWATVTDATKQYGAAATDTLGVQADLAAAGYKGQKLQKSTTEVMKSAMLGEIDYQTATTATIALQQQLHLSTVQLSDSWAYMNSVENSTSLQMKDFAAAIPIALGPIRQMGGDLQDLGTLMTAMISRGVQVGKAANAIKALPQRLSRPSKQVQQEFKLLTGQDIVELNKKNPNNIIGLLTDIENATKNLDTLSRRKALAGLFGTFQLSTMSAMLQGMDDLQNGIGQTTKAYQIGEQSVKDWRQVSDQEIGQMQKSLSQRFKTMINDVKNASVEFGRPFLEVGIGIGDVIVNVMEQFSKLPKIFKIIAAGGLTIAALAGPTLMLIGLLGNLAGNGVKALGSILSLGKAMVLQTTAERAMTKAHQEEQAQMMSATRVVENQAMMLDLLSKANSEAQATTMAFVLAQQGVASSKINAALGERAALTEAVGMSATESAKASAAAMIKEAEELEMLVKEYYKLQEVQAATRYPAGAAGGKSGQFKSASPTVIAGTPIAAGIEAKAQRAVELRANAAVLEASASGTTAKNTAVIAAESATANKFIAGAAAGTVAMGASMALMMGPFGKIGADAGQILLMSTLIVPAIKAANVAVIAMWANTKKAAIVSNLVSLGWKGAATSALGFGRAMMAAIGPVGWVLAAVTAIGVIAYKIWQHNKKITEEHNKQSDILSKQNKNLDEQLSITQKLRKLSPIGIRSQQPGEMSTADMADALYGTKSGKDLINTYKSGDNLEKNTLATQTYMDALNAVGGTADKARKKVEALYIAAGKGSIQAQTDARELANLLGDSVSPAELAQQWGNQMTAALDETTKAASKTGDTLGKRMADAIAKGGPGAADQFLNAMQDQINAQYSQVFSLLPKQTQDYFKKLGITSAKQFDEALADYGKMDMSQKSMEAFAKKWHITTGQIEGFISQIGLAQGELAQPLENIHNLEAGIAGQLSDQLKLAKTATDLDEIRASWAFKLLNVNKQNAAQTYLAYVNQQKILNPLGTLNDMLTGQTDAQRLTLAQQTAQAAGLKVVNNLAEQEKILTEAAKGNFIGQNDELDKQPGKINKINALLAQSLDFSKEQTANLRKTAAQGVQDDVASALQSGFDARQKAATDSLQKYWDKRLQINDRNAQRETAHLESKWEKLHKQADARWERRKDAMTSYYDKRIENVDKAVEAEQAAEDLREKIFEAEKTRIERLNQMANTSIDFNVAINSGNLDEAAKIKNDMQATAADWALADAGTQTKDASDARIKALNDQKDLLQKQKDEALKNLDALEKANQESLDKREKQEKAHLERMQKTRADALKAQEDAANAALANRQAREAAAFDQRLTLFKSYIARDQKDLESWMAQVGLSYDQFGVNTRKKGETWSTWFQESMVSHLQQAGRQIMSDNMWAEMGKAARHDMFNAMGFKGMKEFANFIQNGVLPADYGNRDLTTKPNTQSPVGPVNALMAHHAGGEVGSAASSRIGVARTLKGLHPSETLINAQKGEFIVNKRAAQEHKPLLQAINSGYGLDSRSNVGNGVGGDMGVQTPGLAMGVAATMLVKGIASAMMRKTSDMISSMAGDVGAGSSFTAGKGGHFGDMDFDAEQLSNAAIIAEVGSGMGMSKRDIEVGIMTAITESGLRNLKSGDRDSQGLFQQRPSQGWGTVEQVTNPRYAANAFFSHLKAISNRNDMDPWMEAQTVQRSAFSDGSNYKQYWNEAIDIFTKGLSAAGGSFVAGKGGYQRASIPGKGWVNSHDYRNGLGSPLFAADDGTIVESRAIVGSGTPGNGLYSTPYSSYGETIVLRTVDGDKIRYAHLNPGARFVSVGDRVAGGALIGRSGMTGNASGPHTHFEINGMEIAREWFKSHGIGLDTGGYTTSDGMANLHKDEVVIDPARTNALYSGLDTFTSVMNSVNNIGTGSGGNTGSSTDFGVSRLYGVGDQTEFTPNTNTNQNLPPTAPTPSGPPADSGKAFGLRTGTFNLFNGLSADQQIHDLKELIRKTDVLSLSEYNHPKVGDWLEKQHWGIYDGKRGDTAVAWNKDVIGGLDFNSFPINPKHAGPAGLMHRWIAYGLLRDKKSGRQFYQAAVHTVPARDAGHNVGTVKQRNAVQKEQAENIQALYNELRKTGKPVIFGGDINHIIAAMLKGDKHGAGNNTFQMFGNFDSSKSSMDKTGWNSDHPAVYAKYQIPGLKVGGYTMSDGLAQLHENELVVDPARTKVLLEGIDNLASGGNANYNVHMHVHDATVNADELVNKTITALQRLEERKPQSRRGK